MSDTIKNMRQVSIDKGEAIAARVSANQTQTEPDSYEKAVAELDRIVKELEQTQSDLDQSVNLFQRGLFLANWCEKYLDSMEEKIRQLTAQATAESTEDETTI